MLGVMGGYGVLGVMGGGYGVLGVMGGLWCVRCYGGLSGVYGVLVWGVIWGYGVLGVMGVIWGLWCVRWYGVLYGGYGVLGVMGGVMVC